MSIMDKAGDVLAQGALDTAEAAKRTATHQVVQMLKVGVATAFAKTRGRGTKREINKNLEWLSSPMGDALFRMAFGTVLPMIPKGILGPLAPHMPWICQEMRVQGTTNLLIQGTDAFLNPMQEALLGLLSSDDMKRTLASLPTPETIPSQATGTDQVPA